MSDKSDMVQTDDGLTYRKLPNKIFISIALLNHITIFCTAIMLVTAEGLLIFCCALVVTSLMFLFPAVAYLGAANNYGNEQEKSWRGNFLNRLVAWLFIALTVVLMSAYLNSLEWTFNER